MWSRTPLRAATLVAALALVAAAPAERPALADLAYALGEAHALRQGCRGRRDGYWRGLMTRVLAVETPPEALRLRLVARFNAGFAAARAAHPACDEAALEDARVRAATLARALAKDAR